MSEIEHKHKMVPHAQLIGKGGTVQSVALSTTYIVECFKPDGTLRWVAHAKNTVVNVGLDDVLDKYFKGSAYTAAWYVGLTDGTPTVAAGDTMASHAGWVEIGAASPTEYSEANRPTLTLGTVSGQSVDNSASKASYSIQTTVTIGGAFVTTDNTKGGTTGTLYGAAAFTGGDKSAQNGDTLNVTVTLTAASA